MAVYVIQPRRGPSNTTPGDSYVRPGVARRVPCRVTDRNATRPKLTFHQRLVTSSLRITKLRKGSSILEPPRLRVGREACHRTTPNSPHHSPPFPSF